MSGTSDTIKGRVKEAVGALTDNQRLKNEGKLDQTTGKIKVAVERVIDKAKRVVKDPAKKYHLATKALAVARLKMLNTR